MKEILASPLCPFFVVITTTPLAALLPYKDAADAPFRTFTDSISAGFISFRRDPWVTPPLPPVILLPPAYDVVLSRGTPSTIINGWIEPSIVFAPLILIVLPAPGSPLDLVILTPEALPLKALTTVGSADRITSSAFTTDEVEPCWSLTAAKPKAVTTTSSSSLSSWREILRLDWPDTVIYWVVYPIKLIARTCPWLAAISKFPSKSVDTPVLVPSITTLAPGSGTPFSSLTTPVTLWPTDNKENKRNTVLNSILILIDFIFCY